MNPPTHAKAVPKSIAIFGATGHIGGPLARYLQFHAPQIKLRLLATTEEKVQLLRAAHPAAQVMRADFFEPPSLVQALEGIEGLFVVTTGGMDEAPAMNNLVQAIRQHNCLKHLIRLVGLLPDLNPRRIPQAMRDFGMGLEIQHPIAREILDNAQLPVTYLNCGASFMDNFLRMAGRIQETGVVAWHNRPVTYIDPREIAEVAARLFLSDDQRHVHQFYTMNNGEAPKRVSEITQMMSDVLLRPLQFDGSRESFMAGFAPIVEAGLMPKELPIYLWNFFDFEETYAPGWVPNQFVEQILGRKPTTLRAWLQEHRHHFMDDEDAPTPMLHPAPAARHATSDDSGNIANTSLDGIWDCEVSTPVGKEPHELILRCAPDGSLSGEMKSLKTDIAMPLKEGRWTPEQLSWEMQLVKPIKLNLKVSLHIKGHQLVGKASTGLIGKIPIQGVKRATL